jgi:hypothetical protein
LQWFHRFATNSYSVEFTALSKDFEMNAILLNEAAFFARARENPNQQHGGRTDLLSSQLGRFPRQA